jgi:hypothetical protein
LLDRRGALRDTFFATTEPEAREAALAEFDALGRGLAVLVESDRHQALDQWLLTTGRTELYRDARFSLWRLDSDRRVR